MLGCTPFKLQLTCGSQSLLPDTGARPRQTAHVPLAFGVTYHKFIRPPPHTDAVPGAPQNRKESQNSRSVDGAVEEGDGFLDEANPGLHRLDGERRVDVI